MSEKPKLYLYNTMSRSKVPFKPVAGNEARLYSCGPTVYDAAHIGNLRTYIFMDILRRVLKRNGYALRHVMNITDVGHLVSDEDTGEDKMLKGARERNKTPWEIANEYTELFMRDIAALNIFLPEIIIKATEHIQDMLEMVESLVKEGYGYELADGIYFDISKFGEYGRLSGLDLDEQQAGARVDVNPDKRHPADFALWIKAPKEHIMQWDSPWGAGYPGWHIECSAMSMRYLGDRIDIHTGGVDHIPIHHENEIAQSDAYAGKQVVNIWMHGEFLLVDGGKMSKSLRNAFLIEDLLAKGYAPLAFRYFCLNGHYRNKLNFTWDGMRAAAVAYRRFIDGALAHSFVGGDEGGGDGGGDGGDEGGGDDASGGRSGSGDIRMGEAGSADASGGRSEGGGDDIRMSEAGGDGTSIDQSYLEGMAEAFDSAVNDDLNIPKALGIAWQLIRNPIKSTKIFDLLLDMDSIFGLGLIEAANRPAATVTQTDRLTGATQAAINPSIDVPPDVLELVSARDAARAAKDWTRSDELREQINEKGYSVQDSKQGTKIEKLFKQ